MNNIYGTNLFLMGQVSSQEWLLQQQTKSTKHFFWDFYFWISLLWGRERENKQRYVITYQKSEVNWEAEWTWWGWVSWQGKSERAARTRVAWHRRCKRQSRSPRRDWEEIRGWCGGPASDSQKAQRLKETALGSRKVRVAGIWDGAPEDHSGTWRALGILWSWLLSDWCFLLLLFLSFSPFFKSLSLSLSRSSLLAYREQKDCMILWF